MKEAAVSIKRFPEEYEKKYPVTYLYQNFYSTAGNKYNKPKVTQGVLQPSTSNKPTRQDIKMYCFEQKE